MYKEIKRVVKAAERRGWTLVKGGKHDVLKHPSGRRVQVSQSPSDMHAHKSLRRAIERVEKEIEDGIVIHAHAR